MKKHRAKQGVHMTLYILHTGGAVFQLSSPCNLQHTVPMGLFLMISLYNLMKIFSTILRKIYKKHF